MEWYDGLLLCIRDAGAAGGQLPPRLRGLGPP